MTAPRLSLELAYQRLPAALGQGTPLGLWAESIPDVPAVVAPSGNRTFAELDARCNQLARALRRRGVQAGDSVALMCGNRAEFA
jgi:long-chain acyl-CoA synthetase